MNEPNPNAKEPTPVNIITAIPAKTHTKLAVTSASEGVPRTEIYALAASFAAFHPDFVEFIRQEQLHADSE